MKTNLKKIGSLFLAFLMASALSAPLSSYGESQDVFIYGAGLSENDINLTAEKLGIKSVGEVKSEKLTGSELDEISGTSGTSDSDMLSSVLIKNGGEGSGINVEVVTPANITSITKFQYENACITAGFKDISVYIASVKPVTGESALAGIYKAVKISGIKTDESRVKTAQKEISITSKLIGNNDSDRKFSTEYTSLLTDLKKSVSSMDIVTEERLYELVRKECISRKISEYFTDEDYRKIAGMLSDFHETAAKDENIKKELDKLSESLEESSEAIPVPDAEGYYMSTLKYSKLPEEIKKLLINFPDDMTFIYMTSPQTVELTDEYNPVDIDYSRGERLLSVMGLYEYSIENLKTQPKIDWYRGTEDPNYFSGQFVKVDNHYSYGKFMGMRDNLLELLFMRSNRENWDIHALNQLPFPTMVISADTERRVTLSGYQDVPFLNFYGRDIINDRYVFRELNGDGSKTGILDYGDFIIVDYVNDDIACNWFIRKDAEDFKVDFNTVTEMFPVSLESYKEPHEISEEYLWDKLKKPENKINSGTTPKTDSDNSSKPTP